MSDSLNELQRQILEYRTILDSTPIMIWYKDREGRHIVVNRAAAQLEGLPVTAIEGRTHWELYPKEQAEAFAVDDAGVIESNQPRTHIIEAHTSPMTGKVQWLNTSKVPYRDTSGETIGVIAFALDITPFKEQEAAVLEAIDEMEALIAGGVSPEDLLPILRRLRGRLEG